jgi:hypothetical protein
MERKLELLDLLNTLIIIVEDNMGILKKATLQCALTHLQVTQAKVELLQTHTHLLQDELQQKNR